MALAKLNLNARVLSVVMCISIFVQCFISVVPIDYPLTNVKQALPHTRLNPPCINCAVSSEYSLPNSDIVE